MKTFLQETAEDIIARYGENLDKIQIVLPNKRTGYFFQNTFSRIIQKTVWSPTIITIQQYISKLSRIQKVDKIASIFMLYKSFKAVDNDFSMDFDAFYALGELILNDFNEVDSYLVDVNQIFTNIKDLHEIDQKYSHLSEEQIEIIRKYWINFSPQDMSKEKEKFIRLWNLLPGVYKHFTENLLSNNLAYEGLIYRQIAQNINENILPPNEQNILFVGFNALNAAQKKLFKYLKNSGKADFYWDTDSYYHLNPIQEAGDFLRINFDILNEPKEKIAHNFTLPGKKIQLFGVPGNVGQAKVISRILKKYCNWEQIKKNPENTVIVLTDESMLFPVLNSLPDEIPTFNITMGFPLANSSLYSLILFFLRIRQSIKRKGGAKPVFYYKDVMAFLNHPFIYPAYKKTAQKIINTLKKSQIAYVNQSLLLQDKVELFDLVFTPIADDAKPDALLTRLLNVLFIVFNNLPKDKKGSVEEEFIYQSYVSIKRLQELFEKYAGDIEFSQELIIRILKQLLANVRVPFESKSTAGMQIMGLIETRNIDFDTVVLLNANEGILPNLNRAPSLISESMRHAFGLPVLKYQDAIFGYFFYRLLQRAKNINIVYNNLTGTSNAGELSRYVQQIRQEANIEFHEFQLSQQLETSVKHQIIIEKDSKVQSILNEYFNIDTAKPKMFTPSAIDTYLSCSLKFYFRYLAKIKEPDTVDEEFSPIDLGNIIHAVMENIYKSILEKNKNSLITLNDIKLIYKKVPQFVEQSFKEYYGKSEYAGFEFTGNLLVIKEVIIKYVKSILSVDEKYAPFDIVQLEEDYAFKSVFDIIHENENKKVLLSGIIDRIDKKNGIYRIIDYKTGKAEKIFKDFEQLFSEKISTRKKAVFQLFIYGLLFKNKDKFKAKPVIPGIYDLRGMHKENFSAELFLGLSKDKKVVDSDSFNKHLDEFKILLKEKLSEIFNKDIPFKQTEEPENCTYCPYKDICSVET
ncbi:MAG: PD-(D/E)XK nuclease family protein [Bacteroidales bacterium]|nr:PD-(D/E)XK nuclease family protein [Bacteroidales bacterium]